MLTQAIHAMTEQEVGNLVSEVSGLRKKVGEVEKELSAIKGGREPTLRGIDDKLGQLLRGDAAVCVKHAARLDAVELKNEGYDGFVKLHADTVKEISMLWKIIRWQWVPMLIILTAMGTFLMDHVIKERPTQMMTPPALSTTNRLGVSAPMRGAKPIIRGK
jgi:hypothetical protein